MIRFPEWLKAERRSLIELTIKLDKLINIAIQFSTIVSRVKMFISIDYYFLLSHFLVYDIAEKYNTACPT